jgi:hypothetical protein
MPVTENLPGLESFQQWATGDLVDNRTRGIFAEWLVGQALGCIKPGAHRQEWDAVDLNYCGVPVEVKASGRGPAWPQDKPSTIRFDISPTANPWFAESNDWEELGAARRVADIYVFCLHASFPATSEEVADVKTWQFWVVPTATLNQKFGAQKSVGMTRLDELAERTSWASLRSTVDRVIGEPPVPVPGS